MLENSACTSNRSWGASHVSAICTAVSASAMDGQERIEGFGLATGAATVAAEERGGRTAICGGDTVTCAGGRQAKRSVGCRRTERRAWLSGMTIGSQGAGVGISSGAGGSGAVGGGAGSGASVGSGAGWSYMGIARSVTTQWPGFPAFPGKTPVYSAVSRSSTGGSSRIPEEPLFMGSHPQPLQALHALSASSATSRTRELDSRKQPLSSLP